MARLLFFSKETVFKLAHPRKTSSWIKLVIRKERRNLSLLTYIFCTDAYLFDLNSAYLKHEMLTDVITFDYSNDPKKIDGEIYISIERVRDNASKFNTSFDEELHRVMIHGVLHLMGYNDKKPSEKAQIRKKEEAYLSLQ